MDMRPLTRRVEAAMRFVAAVSRFLANGRWLFMPLGLFALVAVGVHAGADAIDDVLLRFLDFADGLGDAVVGSLLESMCALFRLGPERAEAWSVTFAEWVGLRERAAAAKALAFAVEIAADVLIALPALGYEERVAAAAPRLAAIEPRLVRRFSTLVAAAFNDPTVLRIAGPLATVGVALAGACTVAREVQAATFGALYQVSVGLAAGFGRAAAIGALLAVVVALGGRAVARSLEHAHARAEADRLRGRTVRRRARGLWTALLALPVGVGAVVGGAPLHSFFR